MGAPMIASGITSIGVAVEVLGGAELDTAKANTTF
jgi:hypothetical protein